MGDNNSIIPCVAVMPGVAALVDLIGRVSCELPPDILESIRCASAGAEGNASQVLSEIERNCVMSADGHVPICQDTGIPAFWVTGPGLDHDECVLFEENARQAVRQAVLDGVLRPNAVDSITGRNNGDCTGTGIPQVYFEHTSTGPIMIELLLKGGGSENSSRQYSLPDQSIKAERDLEGVRRCILDAAFQAQGLGCAPGILGVCVGGDRGAGYANAKKQLLRRLDAPAGVWDELESSLVQEINSLGVGPMGLGGYPTVLGVKICSVDRHPASFFVTIAYGCWATRRGRIQSGPAGNWIDC